MQYTVNAKRVEVAVKKVVNGAAPSSLNTRSVCQVARVAAVLCCPALFAYPSLSYALSVHSGMLNPKSLEFFVKHPALGFSPQETRKGKAKL